MGGVESEISSDFSIDELTKRCQKILGDSPAVILGTGATIPHGLPSMTMLARHLLDKVPTDCDANWQAFSDKLRLTNDLEQALHDVRLGSDAVELIVKATWELVGEHDLTFYKRLLSGLNAFPLADVFSYLLRTASKHINVVTTNYDRLAEYAANHALAYVCTGMTDGWVQRFDSSLIKDTPRYAKKYQGAATILKVHGSLDWFRDALEDVVSVPLAQEIPNGMNPLVVTPGVSKYQETHKDPFRTIISAADEVLTRASAYFCIGYGFNDEHIQPVLVRRVKRENIPLLLITKKLTLKTVNGFLTDPPKNFLFLEQADTGTRAYLPEFPEGVEFPEVDIWDLGSFSKLTGCC